MAGKNSITVNDLISINPLIDSDGDSYKVSSVLTSLADMLREDEGLTRASAHDSAFSFGIASVLEVCAAALRHMTDIDEVDHG